MKVFGIGLGRTGTTSLAKALKILGYSCVHYPHDDQAIEDHDAAVDETVACQFKRLDEKYPGSKFIYTSRPMIQWIDSYSRCFSSIEPDTEIHPVIERTYKKLYGQATFDREAWEAGYAKHSFRVKMHFPVPVRGIVSQLLILNVTLGDGWEKLCPFLHKPIPEEAFPWLNTGPSSPS